MNELKISLLNSFQGSEGGKGNKDYDNHNVLKSFFPFHLEFLVSAGMTWVSASRSGMDKFCDKQVDCNNMALTRAPLPWLILMRKSQLIFTLLKSFKNQPTACLLTMLWPPVGSPEDYS